jgi:regulator of sigma E protease
VGIVGYVNEVEATAASPLEAWFFFFYIFSLIAVNLAVMNLLPIPALDGGRVFFLLVTWLIESLTRKKIDPKYEGYIHTAGFILLMGLMIFVMFNDVVKLIIHK